MFLDADQHHSAASEPPSQGQAAQRHSPGHQAAAAAQSGSLLEAHFSLHSEEEAPHSESQQQDRDKGADARPSQVHEAPRLNKATPAPNSADRKAAGPRLSLRERIRMLKGAG